MSRNDDQNNRIASFANSHPELAGDTPASFKNAPDIRRDFNNARASEMVKNEKPEPELKPKNEQQPARETFNQNWLREHRNARMNDYQRQRQNQQQIQYQQPANDHSPER